MQQSKADQIIWWLMVTFMGIIVVGGGAWASDMTGKANRVVRLEESVKYLRSDVNDIKNIMYRFLGNKGFLEYREQPTDTEGEKQ